MPHPTLTLQLRSVEHVCNAQGTLTCPASPYPFKYVQKAKKNTSCHGRATVGVQLHEYH